MENQTTNTEIGTAGYMLFFRGKDWDEELSNEEVQVLLGKVMAWFDGLNNSGKVKGGQPLARRGAFVTGGTSRSVSDGPFAESKEAVGGYLWVDVPTFEEAVEIAKSCPTLDHGITIEVRPVLEECPVFKRLRQRLPSAVAA